MDFTKESICLQDKKLYVIKCVDASFRKIIHQYLENIYPNMHKTSINCKYFNCETRVLKKCYDCSKYIHLKYYYGHAENNIDEYYGGYCHECDCSIEFEPNYDDRSDIIRPNENNVIVIGDYIPLNIPDHATKSDVTKDTFIKIIETCEIYEIDAPTDDNEFNIPKRVGRKGKRQLNKRKNKLGDYICEKLQELQISK